MRIYRYKLGYRAEQSVWGGYIQEWSFTRIGAIRKILKQIYGQRN